jgi:hypothetical protein
LSNKKYSDYFPLEESRTGGIFTHCTLLQLPVNAAVQTKGVTVPRISTPEIRVGQALRQAFVPVPGVAVQKLCSNLALKANAPPTTANSARDVNIILILFIKRAFKSKS